MKNPLLFPDIFDRTSNYINSLFNPGVKPGDGILKKPKIYNFEKEPSMLNANNNIEETGYKPKENVIDRFIPINRVPMIKGPIEGNLNQKKTSLLVPPVINNTSPDVKSDKQAFVDEMVASSEKSIGEQKKYNLANTITNSLLTGGSMIANATADRPEPTVPGLLTPPTFKSPIPEYKNMIDNQISSQLAAGIKVAQETGRPELIPAIIANANSVSNTAYNNLATQDIQQSNLQATAVTDVLNKNTENMYSAKVADNEMIDKINMARSELMGKMGTSLFSTIPNAYMQNKSLLGDMEGKQKLYKYLIEKGDDDAAALLMSGNYENMAQIYQASKGLSQTPSIQVEQDQYYVDANNNKAYYGKDSKWYTWDENGKASPIDKFEPVDILTR